MFKFLYWTTRSRNYNSPLSLGDISMNGWYTTEFFNNGQFKDYEEAGITKLSMPIPNDKYTGTLPQIDENEQVVGTVPKLTRFVMLKYSDLYTTEVDLKDSIQKSSSDTAVQIFATPEECKAWLRANTNLLERSDGVFVIREESVGIMEETMREELLVVA